MVRSQVIVREESCFVKRKKCIDERPHVVVEDKWITRAFHVRFECNAVAKEQRNNQCSSEDAVFRKPLAEIAE